MLSELEVCFKLQKGARGRTGHQQQQTYPPIMNHSVLFETNELCWHGFDELTLPEDKRYLPRRSLTDHHYFGHRETCNITDQHSTIYVPDRIPASIKPGEVSSEKAYRDLGKVVYRQDR